MIEHADIYLKKNRVLNMPEIRSLYNLLSSYRDRRIKDTVKHIRWSVLQKE